MVGVKRAREPQESMRRAGEQDERAKPSVEQGHRKRKNSGKGHGRAKWGYATYGGLGHPCVSDFDSTMVGWMQLWCKG
jgi:hypothetical protein